MNHYNLSNIAENDIDEIISYIAKENPEASLKLLDSMYEAMDKIAENPMLGHRREDLTNQNVRFWPFKWHYLIIYTETSPVEIVRVLSGYRDISNILG